MEEPEVPVEIQEEIARLLHEVDEWRRASGLTLPNGGEVEPRHLAEYITNSQALIETAHDVCDYDFTRVSSDNLARALVALRARSEAMERYRS